MYVGKAIMGVADVIIGRRLFDLTNGWNGTRARFKKGRI